MAYVTQFTCRECRRPREEVVDAERSHVCSKCRAAKAEAEETAHMMRLVALPIEERVRRIELALYRLDADARLKAIEAQHVRYA